MLINFNHIKTLYSALVQKMKGLRGNWEQNDPTADDYIKNRTHYVEIGETVILPLTTLTSEEVQLQQPLVKGQTYSIIWDGVTYESVAREYDGYLMLGNNAIYDYDNGIETDTGEPFALEMEIGYNNAYIYLPVAPRMLDSDGSEIAQHTISIITYGEIVHKLDKKFIDMPDGIVTEDSLPTVLEDTLAPVSFTNDYNSLSGKPTVYTDVVRYGANQSLTTNQKTVARNNIGAANDASVVKYDSAQSLTDEQKKLARTNIGADGISISQAALTGGSSYSNLCCGNNTFIVTSSLTNIELSSNGIIWKKTLIPFGSGYKIDAMAAGNEGFVAIASKDISSAGKIFYSKDGLTWTQSYEMSQTGFYNVSFANNKFFVTLGTTDGFMLYSEDGRTWKEGNFGVAATWNGVTYGKGLFIAYAFTEGAYSEDGITWTVLDKAPVSNCSAISYYNNRFVAIGQLSGNDLIAYSEDGITWNKTTAPFSDMNSLCCGHNKIIAYRDSTQTSGLNKIACSQDGETWIEISMPGVVKQLTYGAGKFVAIIDNNKCLLSYDGMSWSDYGLLQSGEDVLPAVADLTDSYLFAGTTAARTFTWDEDTTGRDSFKTSLTDTTTYYKISDSIFNIKEIISISDYQMIGGTYDGIVGLRKGIYWYNGIAIVDAPGTYSNPSNTTDTFKVPSAGIYFIQIKKGNYVKSATFTYKARALLPDVVGITRTVNGVAPDVDGNVELAIPDNGGGSKTKLYVNGSYLYHDDDCTKKVSASELDNMMSNGVVIDTQDGSVSFPVSYSYDTEFGSCLIYWGDGGQNRYEAWTSEYVQEG